MFVSGNKFLSVLYLICQYANNVFIPPMLIVSIAKLGRISRLGELKHKKTLTQVVSQYMQENQYIISNMNLKQERWHTDAVVFPHASTSDLCLF